MFSSSLAPHSGQKPAFESPCDGAGSAGGGGMGCCASQGLAFDFFFDFLRFSLGGLPTCVFGWKN